LLNIEKNKRGVKMTEEKSELEILKEKANKLQKELEDGDE
jgi:hypothetical protein